MTADVNSDSILALKPARVQRSADGAWRSAEYDDVYFQHSGGIAESHFVFLEKNRLAERFTILWRQAADQPENLHRFTLAELGFGSGLNMLLVWQLWRDIAARYPALPFHSRPRLDIISIEKHPIHQDDLPALHAEWPELAVLSEKLRAAWPLPMRGFYTRHWPDDGVSLRLLLGDVAEMLPQLDTRADAWFLDGFSPAKNPGMWVDEIFPQVAARTVKSGTLSTFSSAGRVRQGLKAAGFNVKKVNGYGIKWSMTVAEMPGAAPEPARRLNVAVIGAGIAGAAVAQSLAQSGCRVTVFDRHEGAAREASGNPIGIIYPKLTVDEAPMGRFYTHAFDCTLQTLTRLKVDGWQACGVLKLDTSAEEKTRHQKLMNAHGYPPEFAEHLEDTPYGCSALLHRRGGMVDPRKFAAALLDHPLIACRFHENAAAPVAGFDATVIATANAALDLPATASLPLRPMRGQMMALRATPASKDITQVLCHDGYLTPAVDGMHYAGTTFQKESPAARAPDHFSAARGDDNLAILEKLNTALPQLGFTAEHIVEGRAAYRATTPNKLPMIGAVPGHENLYVCAGFGAHGLTVAALAGDIIASFICGTTLPIPADLYRHLSPDRVIRREKNG